jgi:biopolymer transport protein ExbD
MSMNVGENTAEDEPIMDINTTPLIDVMLVLLIMLIITIPIQTHAIKLDMPDPNAPPSEREPPPVVTLEVDFDGAVYWNGNLMPDRNHLESQLKREAFLEPQPEFHIRPNKLVEYQHVAGVLASAQRLGITNIGIVGNEQFLQ